MGKLINAKLNELDMQDLVAYEKAIRLICTIYENDIRSRTDSGVSQLYTDFKRFNNLHMRIIDEMKERVLYLEDEDKG